MEYLAFSVKLNSKKKHIDSKDYEPFFKKLYHFGRKIFMIAENDSKNRLHYHGIIHLPIGFYKKNLQCKGFHYKLETVWNMHGWMAYVVKNYQYGDFDDTISLLTNEVVITKKTFNKK